MVLSERGEVEAVHDSVLPDAEAIQGILSPGFVNAHCHLELTALRGIVPKNTGMSGFIKGLQAARLLKSSAELENAVTGALDEAWATGTQAIGDIANSEDSFLAKGVEHRLSIHTFIERFGSNPDDAEKHLANGKKLVMRCPEPASLTPHAPYSVSSELFSLLYRHALLQGTRMSLHLLESEEERSYLKNRTGPMAELFSSWNTTLSSTYDNPIDHALRGLDKSMRILLVHLTVATKDELARLQSMLPNAWLCLCPRSNQYIHNKQPDYSLFDWASERLCLGTDSLASNENLNMLEEIKLVQKQYKAASTEQLLRCITHNGAKFLGFDALGDLSLGKTPGLIAIQKIGTDANLTPESSVRRII